MVINGYQLVRWLDMGLSENSVPIHPMVNDTYPYSMAIIGGIPHFQTYPHQDLFKQLKQNWGLNTFWEKARDESPTPKSPKIPKLPNSRHFWVGHYEGCPD